MLDQEIDKLFKQKVLASEERPLQHWNQTKIENRLFGAKKRKLHNRILAYAACFVLLVTIATFFATNDKQTDVKTTVSEQMKRKKLKEMEDKISGTYYENTICIDCGEIKSIKKNSDVFFIKSTN